MKNVYLLILFCWLAQPVFSQAPERMTYQMVVRDNAGAIVASANVGLRLSILQGSAAGSALFAETHSTTTNANGLVSVLIGDGTVESGSIATINWAEGPFFLRAQTDPTGGSNYSIENISQLVSVPYALHSSEAENAQNSGNGYSHVSATGDTLYFQNGSFVIIPGISLANGGQIQGCTNPAACNYNAAATQDNGSCVYPGCNDALACNYEPSAGCYDGSCYYAGSPCNDNNAATFNDVYNANCICAGSSGIIGAHSCGAQNVHNPNLTYGTMTDQEGNVYKTIVIGTQEWMAENLNTSIYRNGDAIPTNLSNSQWSNTTSGAWAYYNNDASYACPYGKLYNWYAVNDSRNLCPMGWHVPSDSEWSTMINFLDPTADGGNHYPNIAGAAMKSTGTIEGGNGYWYADDSSVEGTNSSGFSGLPGGLRVNDGDYGNVGYLGFWWSSTQYDSYYAWYRYLVYSSTNVSRTSYITQRGHSVRCLRD